MNDLEIEFSIVWVVSYKTGEQIFKLKQMSLFFNQNNSDFNLCESITWENDFFNQIIWHTLHSFTDNIVSIFSKLFNETIT
jgi:hypothetical protein